MNPRSDTTFDPMAVASPDPFSEPRTIPTGWDVSAFYAPERENWRHYKVMPRNRRGQTLASSPHLFGEESKG
jgi:hypothetical protein